MRNFYEKVLPAQGVYCVTGIDDGRPLNLFAETLNEVITLVTDFRHVEANVFVAPGSFKNHSRRAENSAYMRSFFVDLDVGETKPYKSQGEALRALQDFLGRTGLPPPVRINSGGGIHAYWIFDQDVPAVEWKPYAKKFKQFVIGHELHIDATVTADAARIMRAVDTFNHKYAPPLPTHVIDTTIHVYSWEMFKEFLGETEPDPLEILALAEKGLDDDTKKLLRTDNFETTFQSIADRSLTADGCAQIAYILINSSGLPEPLWRAGLSIARHCDDWETAIHLMSEDDERYNRAATIHKAELTLGKPHSCSVFDTLNPGVCDKCPHKGKITNPLAIGRRLKVATDDEPNASEASQAEALLDPFKSSSASLQKSAVQPLPKALFPYQRGVNGGIYFIPPPEKTKEGKVVQDDPILLIPHDLYPIKRMFSNTDGECLMLRATLPHDPTREFMLPMKDLYLPDRFKEAISKQGVLFANNPTVIQLIMNYVIKWGQFLINSDSAEQMRMQMGWTEDQNAFVIGNTELRRDGSIVQTASSPFVRGIAKLLKPSGNYGQWQDAANALNIPGFEMLAFGLMTGFGSTLMHTTSTSGANICFTGKSGCGKTGALYGALSVFGQPKDLSVFDATENGMIGRYLGLHNILLGCDEVSNKRPEQLSYLIHRVSHGKGKIRMQASVNAERELEMSASLINFMTSNQSIYDRLTELKASPDGEVARIIEFNVLKPKPMEEDPRLGKQIFDVFRTHYGHAGPEFIRYCFKAGEHHVRAAITHWSEAFLRDFGGDSAYRFYENVVAATFGAGQLANEAGIINYDLNRIYTAVMTHMLAIRNDTVQLNYTDYKGLLAEYVAKHQHEILILNRDRVVAEPRTRLVARSEIDTGVLYVIKTEFRAYLSELKISTREFEYALKADNVLTSIGKKRLTAGWRAGMSLGPVTAYGFKYDLTDDVIRAAKEH